MTTRKTSRRPAARVTFREWAGLQNGRISTVQIPARLGTVTISVEGAGDEKRFFLRKAGGEHSLLCLATNVDRLNGHLRGFLPA